MDNKRILVTELDFDRIKTNLKNFLRGQQEFTDYDFEGSGMSVLLDLLAYNTHYNSIYANLAVNEAFLDSASKRSNVVSHAKSLGYLPSSAKCAVAVINLTVLNPVGDSGGAPVFITLPALSQFTTSLNGITYNFYNRASHTVSPNSNGEYIIENIPIYEGTPLRQSYIVDDVSPNLRSALKYTISNFGCDLSTLTVRVQDTTSTAGYVTFSRAADFASIKRDDAVYFVQETENQLYDVYFGDGIVGRRVNPGNIVTMDYFVCNKDLPNNSKTFTLNGSISGGTPVVTTISMAQGGSDVETVDSIKFHAPKSYSAQNRAVTAEDYKTLLPQLYPNVESVNVWGGDEAVPPQYGKVFISIKPKSGETLTNSTKELIRNSILRNKAVVSVTPELVDPEYLYITISSSVFYNPLQTDKDAQLLRTEVVNVINDYRLNELQKFGGVFRFSKLSRLIDAADKSFTSNITNIRISKTIIPSINQIKKYTITFNNPIYNTGVPEESVKSSPFRVLNQSNDVYIDDDGVGKLRLYYLTSTGSKSFINTAIGTVNYKTGTVTLNDLVIESSPNNIITINCIPDSNDVVSVRNQIVAIKQESVKVDLVVDTVSSGEYIGGTNYNFRSSHGLL